MAAPHNGNGNGNGLNELSVAVPILFAGKDTSRGTLPPQHFLKEIDAKRTRASWDEATTMAYVTSCLRGEAADWWNSFCNFSTNTKDESTALKNDWTAFIKEFKVHYQLAGPTKYYDWNDTFNQRNNETCREYFSRACGIVNLFCEENHAEYYEKFTSIAKPNNADFANDIESLTGPERAIARGRVDAIVTADRETVAELATKELARTICKNFIISGLRSQGLKRWAIEHAEDPQYKANLHTFMDAISAKEATFGPIQRIRAANNEAPKQGNKGKNPGRRQKQGQKQPGPQGKPNPQQQQPKNKKWCTICQKATHNTADCWGKPAVRMIDDNPENKPNDNTDGENPNDNGNFEDQGNEDRW